MTTDLVSRLLANGQACASAAIRTDTATLSYEDLDRKTRQIAATLQAMGCNPSDRIATTLPRSLNALLMFLGILRARCVAVPIAPGHPVDAVVRMVEASDVSLLLHDNSRNFNAVMGCRCETWEADGSGSFGAMLDAVDAKAWMPVELPEDAGALILFTSGTTGVPKGVLHTVSGLLASAKALADIWEMDDRDRVMHILPISHAHGLIVAVLPVLHVGGALLWLDLFEPRAALRLMPQATCFMGVPFHYQSLLDCADISTQSFAGVRLCTCGSAPLSEELANRFKHTTGQEIAQRYGLTETIILTANPPRRVRPATVGRALPGTMLSIVDPKSGELVAPGEIGEVLARGDALFSRYINRDMTEVFTDDGAFRTGDLGRLDDAGYLTLVGRRKDLIIYSGLNVYPKDVEMRLDRLTGVRESCVFGVPHPLTGESVMAAVVADPGAVLSPIELRKQLLASLAPHQVPKRIWIVPEIPRNELGKPLRDKLTERFSAPINSMPKTQ